jgi:hypothetical protein
MSCRKDPVPLPSAIPGTKCPGIHRQAMRDWKSMRPAPKQLCGCRAMMRRHTPRSPSPMAIVGKARIEKAVCCPTCEGVTRESIALFLKALEWSN